MATAKNEPVALVTGSARRIGAAINRQLHQRGWHTIIHYRSSDRQAQRLADELNRIRPQSASVMQADLQDDSAPQHLAEQIEAQFGRLDLLVHNASGFYPTPIGSASLTDWNALFTSNARAPFFLSQACVPLLRRSEAGAGIISILDVHSERPLKQHTLYCMAKSAQQTMVKSLARELAPQIRVNGVAPGAILWPQQADERQQETILQRIPMQRAGEPQDIAGAVAFLALDAPYITGQVVAVDGGRSLFM